MKKIFLSLFSFVIVFYGCNDNPTSENPTEEVITTSSSINWEQLPFSTADGSGSGSLTTMLLSSENILFGRVNGKFSKSSDFGKTWKIIELPEYYSGSNGFYLDRQDNLYVVDFLDAIWKSDDNGNNWVKVGGHFN